MNLSNLLENWESFQRTVDLSPTWNEGAF